MSHINDGALASLAKEHLSFPSSTPDGRIPHFYIEELRRHIALYPTEDQFRVTLQPGQGLGYVTCLKDDCNQVVPLVRRIRAHDGGKSDGLGSLSAYRSHISESHSAYRQKLRVKSESIPLTSIQSTAAPQSSSLIKGGIKAEQGAASIPQTPSSHTFPPHAGVIQTQGSALVRVKPEAVEFTVPRTRSHFLPSTQSTARDVHRGEITHIRVKPEIVESVIPRKRPSDVALSENPQAVDSSANSIQSLPKKAKTEPTTKNPLVQVTNSPMFSTSGGVSTMYPSLSMDGFDDPYVKLENIQIAMSIQESALDRMRQKPRLSAEDCRTIADRKSELQRLRIHEQETNRLLMGSPPVSYNQPIVKTEPAVDRIANVAKIINRQSRPPTNRKPNVPQPFPMSMDVDRKPFIKPEQSMAPFAASSSTPPATQPQAISPWNWERKPLVTPPKLPVASSSKGSSPPFPKQQHFLSDDFDMNMSDSENEDYLANGNPTITADLVNRIGIHVPPPIDNDAQDSNGDYYGRGRDLFEGPRASANDLEKFLVAAGNVETFDGNASVDKALKYLGLKSLDDKLPGMEVSLMAHQALGVAWMVEKEKSVFLGGCLADEMGLGKTIQMIATMLKNRSTDPSCKTTLIIAPLALLDQWKAEIEERTNCGITCLIYHGSSKTKKKSELTKYDVVLTTFGTMSQEWPDYEKMMKAKAKAKKNGDSFIVSDDDEDMKDAAYRTNKRKQQAGLLFQVTFYRIVGDEGQTIRNRRTRVSRAITDLRATHRWLLTGTPIVNTLADVYGYLRFLKIRPWYDWSEFQREVGIHEKKNPGLAVARLQTIMHTFLLRRKKDSTLDGKKLIDLPEKEVKLIKLEFSEEERDIYQMVEARSQAKFNRYLRAGTVLKNYHQVLVLLLRLRQICSHPSLIQEDGVAFVDPNEADVEPEFATELTRARRLVSSDFVDKLKEKFRASALARIQAEKESANATIEQEDCPICFDVMTDAVVTSCSHIFCRDCIVDALNTAPPVQGGPDEPAPKADERPCPVCRTNVGPEKLFSREAFEPTDKELDPTAGHNEDDEDIIMVSGDEAKAPVHDRKGKGKAASKPTKPRRKPRRAFVESDDEGDDVNVSGSDEDDGDGDDEDMSDFIVESDEDEEEKDARRALKKRPGKKRVHVILDSDDELDTPEEKEVIFGVRKKVPISKEAIKLMPRFLPSSKMKYMMDQLLKLQKTNPEEKTLLVSQWTGCLSLISSYLTENGIPHVKYQGDMSRNKRDQAVKVFMAKEKARVMLMSLKCGGVGLNLTRANNVISLDLGWSQAVESQAFDRVHRVGQMRKVHVQRVVIADTVEDRILKMQERKQTLADGSLGEGSGKKIGKLSVKELANLFGLDARGRLL